MLLRRLAGPAAPKASVVLEPMLAFVASHEACRRMAVFPIQLTRSYTKPASREAYCRAAVSPQPSCMSLKCSCALWAGAVWGQGVLSLVRAMRPVAEWRSFLFN